MYIHRYKSINNQIHQYRLNIIGCEMQSNLLAVGKPYTHLRHQHPVIPYIFYVFIQETPMITMSLMLASQSPQGLLVNHCILTPNCFSARLMSLSVYCFMNLFGWIFCTMLHISTLLHLHFSLLEAFLRTSVLHTGPEEGPFGPEVQ